MKVQCMLCGRWFKAIGARHCALHNITIEEYKKQFAITCLEEKKEAAKDMFERSELAIEAFYGLSDKDKVDVLAHSGAALYSDEARERILSRAYIVTMAREKLFSESLELLLKLMGMLKEPWALETDENGNPLSISDKLKIGEFLKGTVKATGEAMLSLANNVLQDNKSVVGKPSVAGRVFTGEEDKLPALIPSGFEREKVRLALEDLISRINKFSEPKEPTEIPLKSDKPADEVTKPSDKQEEEKKEGENLPENPENSEVKDGTEAEQ